MASIHEWLGAAPYAAVRAVRSAAGGRNEAEEAANFSTTSPRDDGVRGIRGGPARVPIRLFRIRVLPFEGRTTG
jgi:hypothetical protein